MNSASSTVWVKVPSIPANGSSDIYMYYGNNAVSDASNGSSRALNRAVEWLRANEDRSREQLLRDLTPEQRKTGMLPELLGVQSYKPAEFQEKVDWMMDRGYLKDAPAYSDVVRGK